MTHLDLTFSDKFALIPGNPPPDGAKAVWYRQVGGLNLRACLAPAPDPQSPRGTVIVCPGRTEFIEKYFEVARELQSQGFATLILDWPGQGRSERLLEDRAKGHIDTFDTFTSALRSAFEAMQDDLPRPHIVLAHSMGGAIALSAMAGNVVQVDAAAFNAPMWGIKAPFPGMGYVVGAMNILGRSGAYAVPPGPAETFKTNVVTHDEPHWQMNRDLLDADPMLELGPVTWGWLRASLKVFKLFAKADKIGALNIPVMVATAQEEKLVDNNAHSKVARLLPDCEHIEVAGARHEILMEKEDKRAEFWAGFDRLLKRASI